MNQRTSTTVHVRYRKQRWSLGKRNARQYKLKAADCEFLTRHSEELELISPAWRLAKATSAGWPAPRWPPSRVLCWVSLPAFHNLLASLGREKENTLLANNPVNLLLNKKLQPYFLGENTFLFKKIFSLSSISKWDPHTLVRESLVAAHSPIGMLSQVPLGDGGKVGITPASVVQ